MGVLFTLGVAFVTELFAPAFAEFHLSPISTALVLLSWIAFLLIFTAWQFVGIWRSAGRQIERGKRGYLGGLARLAVVIGLLRFGGDMFTVGGPIASQSFRLFPEAGSDLDLTRHVPKEVLQSDLDALKELIHEGARNPMRYSSESAKRDLSQVFNSLSARAPNALDIIAEPHKYFSQPGALCGAFIAFYSEILSLPQKQSGQLLRFILDQPPQ